MALYAGTAIGFGGAMSGSETGEALGYVVYFTYPLAASIGAFAAGEGSDGPSENAGAVFGYTVLAAYGQLGVFLAGAGVYNATTDYRDEPFENATYVDAALKPVVVTLTYNLVKKPASPPEIRLAVEPYVSVAAASDGGAIPTYGLTVSF